MVINAVNFFARWRLYSESIFATLSQVIRADFTSNTSTLHNGRPLARKFLKGWTRDRHSEVDAHGYLGRQRLPPARFNTVTAQI
jgi:hypothetical protein